MTNKEKYGNEIIELAVNTGMFVLKNGEPIEGIGFEVGKEKSKSVTNKFGIAQIEIKEKGLNVIAAIDSEQELNDPNANTLLLQSSISFELK